MYFISVVTAAPSDKAWPFTPGRGSGPTEARDAVHADARAQVRRCAGCVWLSGQKEGRQVEQDRAREWEGLDTTLRVKTALGLLVCKRVALPGTILLLGLWLAVAGPLCGHSLDANDRGGKALAQHLRHLAALDVKLPRPWRDAAINHFRR